MNRLHSVAVLVLVVGNLRAQPEAAAGRVDVLTQHNDNDRTGANLRETELTPALLASGNFGLLHSHCVDGNIYAQPLYVESVIIPKVRRKEIANDRHSVVYVATEHNTVFAFDANTPGPPLWWRNLGPSVPSGDITKHMRNLHREHLAEYRSLRYQDMTPEIGITSTPVIDLKENVIYVVAKTKEGTAAKPIYFHRIFALDLGTGEDKYPPREIEAKLNDQGQPDPSGKYVFGPLLQLNRPGLLFTHEHVYVAFGGTADSDPFYGWVFAYEANLKGEPTVFCTALAMTECNDGRAGIWQSGNGLASAVDKEGHVRVYFETGNGAYDGKIAFGDSVVGLRMFPRPKVMTYFTPFNQVHLDKQDVDLGSSGPVLIPDTNLLIGAGKEGKLYLLDRFDMGGYSKDDEPLEKKKILQSFQVTIAPTGPNPGAGDYHHIHGGPILWNRSKDDPLVYVWGEMDFLKAYNLRNKRFPMAADCTVKPFMQSTVQAPTDGHSSMPGGFLSLSAHGEKNGILWATLPTRDANQAVVPGVFYAFDASDIKTPLWRSTDNPRDNVGYFAKFCAPTVAKGKIYLASFADPTYPDQRPARLLVYGQIPRDGGMKAGH